MATTLRPGILSGRTQSLQWVEHRRFEISAMAKAITVRIPHALGKDEARHRIDEGFGKITKHLSGSLIGAITFQHAWAGDQLVFSGGAFGQRVSGRITVLNDEVVMELDLPTILAALADRIAGRMKNEAWLLLERK
jgi:hypothetical protein